MTIRQFLIKRMTKKDRTNFIYDESMWVDSELPSIRKKETHLKSNIYFFETYIRKHFHSMFIKFTLDKQVIYIRFAIYYMFYKSKWLSNRVVFVNRYLVIKGSKWHKGLKVRRTYLKKTSNAHFGLNYKNIKQCMYIVYSCVVTCEENLQI